MYDMSGFSYDITDVVHLLQLRVRHKNSSSMDVNCPFCGETKGKMNVNLQKNVFRCNRCDASGGMLNLEMKQMQELLQDTFMILILEKTGLAKNLRQLGQEQSHIFRQQ